jgi:hypothetical protein
MQGSLRDSIESQVNYFGKIKCPPSQMPEVGGLTLSHPIELESIDNNRAGSSMKGDNNTTYCWPLPNSLRDRNSWLKCKGCYFCCQLAPPDSLHPNFPFISTPSSAIYAGNLPTPAISISATEHGPHVAHQSAALNAYWQVRGNNTHAEKTSEPSTMNTYTIPANRSMAGGTSHANCALPCARFQHAHFE